MFLGQTPSGFSGYDQLVTHRRKILRAVVGTHFYQTHPDFIANFMNHDRVRFVKQPDGVFHPKLYLFENSPKDWSCLLGSANFTNGAFTSNSEASVIFDSDDDENGSIKAGLVSALRKYSKIGEAFDPNDLEYYRSLWRRFRRGRKSMSGKFGDKKHARPVLNAPLLKMSWVEYLKNVLRDKQHGVDGRIRVLEASRHLFEQHREFTRMSTEERRGIAGFGREDDVPWGWFGSMSGAGVFTNRVNANDPNLSRALDAIPLNGEVRREHYIEFIEVYRKAFPAGRRHGLATATRLLAMKRPDYFVCFDSANQRSLCEAFGISLYGHDYDRYWDSVVERILISQWWTSPRPKQTQAVKVWDGRAAFLDSL
jgi:PLD-like domain